MKPVPSGFRERLLEQERVSPALRQRYEREIEAMLEKTLSGPKRWGALAIAVAALALAAVFGTWAALAPAGLPTPARIGLAGGAAFAVGWAVVGLRVFRRGRLHLRADTGAVTALSWGLPVFMVTILLVAAPDTIVGLRMISAGLVFLVMGAVFLLRHVVEQSELKTREKLLEIEYRLAVLAQTAAGEGRPGSAAGAGGPSAG